MRKFNWLMLLVLVMIFTFFATGSVIKMTSGEIKIRDTYNLIVFVLTIQLGMIMYLIYSFPIEMLPFEDKKYIPTKLFKRVFISLVLVSAALGIFKFYYKDIIMVEQTKENILNEKRKENEKERVRLQNRTPEQVEIENKEIAEKKYKEQLQHQNAIKEEDRKYKIVNNRVKLGLNLAVNLRNNIKFRYTFKFTEGYVTKADESNSIICFKYTYENTPYVTKEGSAVIINDNKYYLTQEYWDKYCKPNINNMWNVTDDLNIFIPIEPVQFYN